MPSLPNVARMKKTSSLALLAGCQIVAAVGLASLSAYYVIYARQLTQNNTVLSAFQSSNSALEMLVGVSVEYAQKDPAGGAGLGPLLARLGIKITTNSPAQPRR